MTSRTINICFQDVPQLKEDLIDFVERWEQTVRAGDELILKVVAPTLGQKK